MAASPLLDSRPIRVLVVDDSALMRHIISDALNSYDDIEVVGLARDGLEALQKTAELAPDVITLDVEMPRMDGIQTLGELMKRQPARVIMLSSLTQAGAQTTLDCLTLGAIDFVSKVTVGGVGLSRAPVGELVEKIRIAAKSRVSAGTTRAATARPRLEIRLPIRRNEGLLVIGSSTGGPRALETLVPAIPTDIGVPVVIVQHMPANFTASLASRLDRLSSLHVKEAAEGDRLAPGVALVAPGGHHLTFDARGVAQITSDPPVHSVRPSVDVTLFSLEKAYGRNAVAVLLTGMGRDGAEGLKAIKTQGGQTLVEDESTCVVFGMPKAAIELGAAGRVVPLGDMAQAIMECFAGRPA